MGEDRPRRFEGVFDEDNLGREFDFAFLDLDRVLAESGEEAEANFSHGFRVRRCSHSSEVARGSDRMRICQPDMIASETFMGVCD